MLGCAVTVAAQRLLSGQGFPVCSWVTERLSQSVLQPVHLIGSQAPGKCRTPLKDEAVFSQRVATALHSLAQSRSCLTVLRLALNHARQATRVSLRLAGSLGVRRAHGCAAGRRGFRNLTLGYDLLATMPEVGTTLFPRATVIERVRGASTAEAISRPRAWAKHLYPRSPM
jgi:hypothetical protein